LPAPARGFWPALARIVTVKPALILIVTLGALAVPAWRGVGLTWVYDTLAGTSASYESGVGNAAAGVEIAKRHWPIGEIAPVTVCGWVWHWRDHGGVVFIDLRDRAGHIQLVFDPQADAELHRRSTLLRSEFVITATGRVRRRPPGTENPNIATGEVEVVVAELTVFSEAETPPFPIDDHVEVGEDVRLKHRYLDLRRPVMRDNILFRSRCYHVVRSYFFQN
jgi:aspartyl/asparaginyl-tRNA synthetase